MVAALCEILGQCNSRQKFYILHLNDNINSTTLINGDNRVNCLNDSEINIEGTIIDHVSFHDNVRIRSITNLAEVEKYYLENINILKAQYGILLFLYSVIITKVCHKSNLFNSLAIFFFCTSGTPTSD